MKAKVINRFRDIFTNELFETGTVYEADEKRVKDLQNKGYLGEVLVSKKKKTRKTNGEGE